MLLRVFVLSIAFIMIISPPSYATHSGVVNEAYNSNLNSSQGIDLCLHLNVSRLIGRFDGKITVLITFKLRNENNLMQYLKSCTSAKVRMDEM